MRVPPLIIASFFVPVGLLYVLSVFFFSHWFRVDAVSHIIRSVPCSWYGWSARASVHWIVPMIGAGFFSFAMMGTFLPITLYLVDSFRYAASAMAAAVVIRSILGFVFPLFGDQMFDALHTGPGYSLLAGLAILTGIPFPIWIYLHGEKIRLRSDLNR